MMLLPLCLLLLQDSPPLESAGAFGNIELGVAAEVLGLGFTEEELALMLPDVLERVREFETLRAVPLTNDVPPALEFRPLGWETTGTQEKPWSLPFPPAGQRPDDLEELAFLDILELGALLHAERVTCVEVAETFLARLERLDDQLHCLVNTTRERALAQARTLDAELARGESRGVLHGIPWVAKDLLAVAGTPTTWGTPPYREQTLGLDAAVVERLDGAGAILIAKVSLGELAWGDVWFGGKTRNPWKPEQGSSGSSAGPASAVAAGCATFAIGSETYGSIVSPSARCGNSSLRPTFGRVSRHGAMTLCWSLDKLGPICRSARDALLVFRAISGADPRDSSTLGVPARLPAPPPSVQGWKVGIPRGAFAGAGARCESVLEELEQLGVELVDVELPDYPVNEMMIVLTAEAGAAFDEFSRGSDDDRMVRQERFAWPNTFRHATLIPAVDYIRANRLRTLLIRDFEEALGEVRAIVHPSFALSLLATTNLGGQPTFVAPCGFSDDGTPYSISFTGRLHGDAEVLALAQAWQGVSDYHLRHP